MNTNGSWIKYTKMRGAICVFIHVDNSVKDIIGVELAKLYSSKTYVINRSRMKSSIKRIKDLGNGL